MDRLALPQAEQEAVLLSGMRQVAEVALVAAETLTQQQREPLDQLELQGQLLAVEVVVHLTQQPQHRLLVHLAGLPEHLLTLHR